MIATLSRIGFALALFTQVASAAAPLDVHCTKAGKAWSELSKADQDKALAGEVLLFEETPAGKDWPLINVYFVVESTPEEAMAVFADYNRQKEYMPGVIESKIKSSPGPRRAYVYYVIDAVFRNSWYNTQNILAYDSKIDQFRADWTKYGEAQDAKVIDGVVRTEAVGGAALVAYRLYTEIDGGIFTGIARGQGPGRAQKTMTALRDRIRTERKSMKELLRTQVEALRKELAAQ